MADEKESSFRVTDRRKFNPDGSPRESSEEHVETGSGSSETAFLVGSSEPTAGVEPQRDDQGPPGRPTPNRPASAAEPAKAKARPHREDKPGISAAENAYRQAGAGTASSLPQASFLGLVNMLGVEAAMALGMIETPDGGARGVDLEAARHLIDMLGVLENKTRGNLTAEEDAMFENLLADLRMQFVVRAKNQ